jgi:hypothetical protein
VQRHGSPEIHLAQLDPFDDSRIVRILIIRYDPHRFAERIRGNESFRSDLESMLTTRHARGEIGYFSGLLKSAHPTQGTTSALIDAEVETMAYVGDRAGIVFFVASPSDMHYVIKGTQPQLDVVPELEATMPTRVLADLLLSWKEAAEAIKQ